MNRQDPAIRGEHLGERVWLHQVASKATSLVHVNRYFRPEVILFGNDHRLRGQLHSKLASRSSSKSNRVTSHTAVYVFRW